MKSTVEHLNPTRVKLTVEVPFDELKPHFDKAYGALAGQVRIPGFRPGKVPARILDARLGRGTILSEVVNDAVPAKYGEAITTENIRVLGQPDIEVTRIDDGDALEFTAEVDVRPDIELPDPASIAVTVPDVAVEDSDIDAEVAALQDRFASTVAVERAAAEGDLVSIDLSAESDGEAVADASTEGLSYVVGAGDLVDGLDDAVTGLSAGESATFTTSLVAGDHAGQDVQVTVVVQTVSERTLPEVDDDFAQLASEFDTIDELRADLAEKIRRVKNLEQGGQARDQVLEALLDATEIPAPEKVVEAELASRAHDAVHVFDHDEDALTAHVESQGQTREDFDAELRDAAVKAVRTQLLLDALAEKNDVGVNQDEFTQRVIFNAQRYGMSPDEYFKRVQENDQIASIFSDVRRGKALAGAVEKATVTSESGDVLDIAALFGVELDDTADGAGDGRVVDAAEGATEATDVDSDADADADADAQTGAASDDIQDDGTDEAAPAGARPSAG